VAPDARLAAAFAEEELDGLRLAVRVRLVGCAVIAAWTLIENRYPGALYYFGIAVAFALLGLVPLWLRRAGVAGSWPLYVFPLLDVSLFTLAVLLPNPLEPNDLPPQVRLRFGNELYLFLLIMATVFSYRPLAVLWCGVAAALVWSIGVLRLLALPGSIGYLPAARRRAMTSAEVLAFVLDPQRVDVGLWGRLVVLLLVLAGGLAIVVRRSRRLVARQVETERARSNLARYFSPNLVDELALSDEPLRTTRQQDVAVLFVDVVGFTGLASAAAPDAVIGLLRDFHRRMVAAVFAHGGTVDKYLGDGLMVTFGTPRPAPDAAARALACARAMLDAVQAWSRERTARGEAPIRIGVGAHYGPVVLGDIGDERHLEFAVVGDTVNVASRLQELTRSLGVTMVASDALVAGARRAGDAAPGLVPHGTIDVRGRDGALSVWVARAPG